LGEKVLKRYSANFDLLSIVFDGVSVLSVMGLVLYLIPWPDGNPKNQGEIHPFLLLPTIWFLVNVASHLYDSKRNNFFVNEVLLLFVCSLISCLVTAGIAFFFEPSLSRYELAIFIIFGTLLQILWRVGVRIYWRVDHQHRQVPRYILILGAGDTGHKIADTIRARTNIPHPIIRYLDDDPELQTRPEVIGPLSMINDVFNSFPVNDIIIALPLNAYEKISRAVVALHTRPVNIWSVPASYRLALYRVTIEDFAGIPLLDLRAPAISRKQRLAKRAFDVLFSISVLLLVSLPMLVIALLIKCESPGPVLFRQKRIGENGKPFEMLKFRSMVDNAEKMKHIIEKVDANGNILHKHKDDPRITRVGRILRRTSLDELPQFINVLMGEMSVVGPRPELPYLVEKYDVWQHIRFTVPPGITGWWQISGRSDAPMHLNTEKDIFYIKNYSFLLDMQIIVRTIWAVLYGKGAY
jgi:exopolysaccharide biosynthesis polyprenyl glycosylphosphotransferase